MTVAEPDEAVLFADGDDVALLVTYRSINGKWWLPPDRAVDWPDVLAWVAERGGHRVESDTSSNARPDTADDGTYWPE